MHFVFLKMISVMASSIFVLQRLIHNQRNTADIIAIFTWRIYPLLYCFIQSVNDLHHVIVFYMTIRTRFIAYFSSVAVVFF
jgi:hypothetical protein